MGGSMTKVEGPMENKWPHDKTPCVINFSKCRRIIKVMVTHSRVYFGLWPLYCT